MRYLIDGYNLLHAAGRIGPGPLSPVALERARLWLVRLVDAKHPPADRLTLVFDAQDAPRTLRPVEHHGRVEVVLALDDEADDEIERQVRADPAPQQLTVVSNDRRVLAAARRRGRPLRCDQYLDLLERFAAADRRAGVPEREKPETLAPSETAAWLAAFEIAEEPPAVRRLDYERAFLEWEERQ